LVEQRTENPCVPGSIPGGTTKIKSQVKAWDFLIYKMFTVYVIYSESVKKKYTGYTHDIELRLHQHNNGLLGTYTKNKGPWKLIYSEVFQNKADAIFREKELKSGKGREFIKLKTGY
jgi:putative endonuclease